jgi:prephenate dehydrogenase
MTRPSETIGIAGLGLMGGSLALALRRRAGRQIVGYDPDPAVLADALRLGIIDRAGSHDDVAACPVAFVAAPLGRLGESFAALAKAEGVVTDLGSTKQPAVMAGEAVFGGRFVGGHPMAGSEKVGLAGADADLFDRKIWVLTPTEQTNPEALRLLEDLLPETGAIVVRLDAAAHDAAVAMISHLPYLVACALVETAQGQPGQAAVKMLAASGFRDTTRLAMANPVLGRDMCLTNGDAIVSLIPQLQAVLTQWQQLVDSRDTAGLDAVFQRAAAWRSALYAPKDPP